MSEFNVYYMKMCGRIGVKIITSELQSFTDNPYVKRVGMLAATTSLLLGGCALQESHPDTPIPTASPSATSESPTTLRAGDSGLPVAHLQQLLHDAGCEITPDLPLETSGYGRLTVKAVSTYQTNKGLPVTGEATPQLQQTLSTGHDKYCGADQPPAITTPSFVVSEIDPAFAQRMVNVSWRKECLAVSDLRIVEVPYHDLNDKTQMGKIVINKVLAQETGQIFTEIYKTGYEINQIKPIEDVVPANTRVTSPAEATKLDEISMKNDNTSGFNCRSLNGKIDKHGLGDAIDINPLKNPMVEGDVVDPVEGKPYLDPKNPDQEIFSQNRTIPAKVIAIFKSRGWRWGGDWKHPYDRQHFDRVPS